MVIVDRQDNIKKMDVNLSDQKEFCKVNLRDDTLLNFAINLEKQVDKVLKIVLNLIVWQKKLGNP